MKKLSIVIAIMLVIGFAGYVISAPTVGDPTVPITKNHSFVQEITISADETGNMPAIWKGYYLAQVHVSATLDDAFTVTINHPDGGEIGTITTTAATSGEFMPLASGGAETRYITGTTTYTTSGIGSGTITLECVLVQ